MKLKTLKDFEVRYVDDLTSMRYEVIKKSKLKAEAIKWVKEILRIEKERGNYIKGSKNNSHINPRNAGKIRFIKEFFNITEEDLK